MIRDCEQGKLDRIIVKSISRLARNTHDLLVALRAFKDLGVSVYFEEQDIDTDRINSEMLISFPGMLAQQESESISGNMRWSYKKRIEFLDPYIMPERAGRIVRYASKDELTHEISMRHLRLPVEAANAPEGMSDNAIPFSESTSEKTTKLKTGETAGTEDTNEQP